MNEPLPLFNTRFQRMYKRLRAPYFVKKNIAIQSFEGFVSTVTLFLKRMYIDTQIDTLAKVYHLAIQLKQQINPSLGGIRGNLPSLGYIGIPNQIMALK